MFCPSEDLELSAGCTAVEVHVLTLLYGLRDRAYFYRVGEDLAVDPLGAMICSADEVERFDSVLGDDRVFCLGVWYF